jgi:hypothetical protein
MDSSELRGVSLGDIAGVVGPPPVDPFPLSIDHRHELPDPSGNPPEALPSPPLKAFEAIVSSLAVDSMAAALYVHWRGADSRSFHLQRIGVYLIARPDELIQLQAKIRQIVSWGMGPRLVAIKKALNILIEQATS